VIKTLLKHIGCRVLTALSAAGGLAILNEHDVDIVFSDLNMPEMDGIQFAREIKNSGHDIPVVIVTAGGTSRKEEALQAGAVGFIEKPVSKDELEESLSEHTRHERTINVEVSVLHADDARVNGSIVREMALSVQAAHVWVPSGAEALRSIAAYWSVMHPEAPHESIEASLAKAGAAAIVPGEDAVVPHLGGPLVLLIDRYMPGMSGLEAAQVIRSLEERHPMLGRIPIVLLTGDSGEEVENAAREVGIDRTLTKPVRRSELIRALRSSVRGSSLPDMAAVRERAATRLSKKQLQLQSQHKVTRAESAGGGGGALLTPSMMSNSTGNLNIDNSNGNNSDSNKKKSATIHTSAAAAAAAGIASHQSGVSDNDHPTVMTPMVKRPASANRNTSGTAVPNGASRMSEMGASSASGSEPEVENDAARASASTPLVRALTRGDDSGGGKAGGAGAAGAPGSPSVQLPLVDFEALHSLTPGDTAACSSFVDEFLDSAGRDLSTLAEHCDDVSERATLPAAAKHVAHKICGAADSLGLARLGLKARQTEVFADNPDVNVKAIPPAVRSLMRVFDDTSVFWAKAPQ
jgi:CheY-like chemotaxis protein